VVHTSWSGRWVFGGEGAELLWDGDDQALVDFRLRRPGARGQKQQRFTAPAKTDSMQRLIKRFADAVKSGGPMPVPLADNVRTIGLALAVVESCWRRKEIDVQRFLEKEGLCGA